MYIAADDYGVYADVINVTIDYSTFAFGNDAASFGNVSVTALQNFANPTYGNPTIPVADFDPSSITFAVATDIFNQSFLWRTELTPTPQPLAHVAIKYLNCDRLTDIYFANDAGFLFGSLYTDAPDADWQTATHYEFADVYFTNALTDRLCKPVITYISPELPGGTGELCTIRGRYFGNSTGRVSMTRVKESSATPTQTFIQLEDIKFWSDTLIYIEVPNRVYIDFTGGGPYETTIGSGKIGVDNFQDSALSSQEILIRWSLMSTTGTFPLHDPHDRFRFYLRGPNGSGGYNFRLDSSVANYPAHEALIRKALRDWTCATGINWQIEPGYYNGPPWANGALLFDLVNTIRIVPPDSNILGSGWTQPFECFGGFFADQPMAFPTEMNLDVIASHPVYSLLVDTTGGNKPPNWIDLYAVILHEFGHLHLLDHVNQENQLMYYADLSTQFLQGYERHQLDWMETDAGIEIVNMGEALQPYTQACIGTGAHVSDITVDCTGFSLGITNSFTATNLYITAYPTPSNGIVNLDYIPNGKPSEILITSTTGQLIESIQMPKTVVAEKQLDLSGLADGLYYITVICGDLKEAIPVPVLH